MAQPSVLPSDESAALTDVETGAEPEVVEPVLTPREHEVLDGISRGLMNKEIGAEIGLSEKTVKAHVTALFKKLGVRNRTQAALAAVRAA